MSDIKWEEPPTLRARKMDYEPFAAELRLHPGQWAVLPFPGKFNHGVASNINTGSYKAFRPVGHYEARSGGEKTYVRYVGEPS